MATVRVEHVFNCSEDTYWGKLFFEDEYNRRMFRDALGFPSYEKVSQTDRGDTIERVVELVPPTGELPGPLKKLIGDGLGYRESGRFDKQRRRFEVSITPNKLADKITITGVLRTEPTSDGKCRRIYEGSVEARVFGVGGMIEKRVISDVEQNYAKAAAFTNQYLIEQGL
ncbi:MAG: DUF2505 domain-containing protein [Sorangiineae bacterium]|nr:DUF2505 domain-containing protein [Polyangiaceae bacterium]MEB2320925.1 DUF2505 domain-containing protein [Sorangiineae bacterium]